MKTRLSQTRASKFSKPGQRYCDGGGLYLQVHSDGNRSWTFRYKDLSDRRERWMGLGPFADVSLDDARDAARDARNLLRKGIDPITERKDRRAENIKASSLRKTFQQAADAYIDANKVKWTPRHAASVRDVLVAYALPTLGEKAVAAIDKPSVIDCLTPIWSVRYATACKVQGLLAKILDYSEVCGWRDTLIIDMCLAHKIPDKTKAAYLRGDLFQKRTQAMTMWASYCYARPVSKSDATVTPIRAAG